MLNFLFEQIIIFWEKRVIVRFTHQKYLLTVVPIKVTRAFIAGLCLNFIFAASTANNASNTTAVSANNSTQIKASLVRIGYRN
jgi:sulfonate transport system substrate-binding protein